MATERLREIRDWINLGLTTLTVAIIPMSLVLVRNFRLETREEMRQGYVALDVYRAELARRDAEITSISAKLDRLNTSVVRLTDAVKLKDPP